MTKLNIIRLATVLGITASYSGRTRTFYINGKLSKNDKAIFKNTAAVGGFKVR